jgi:hypothetical protein
MIQVDIKQFINEGIQQYPKFLTKNQEHSALLFLCQRFSEFPENLDIPFVQNIFQNCEKMVDR